tara:strand:- start:196 stop:621 length:426 start_codon:yes stop_codon:yes gene_type:complete
MYKKIRRNESVDLYVGNQVKRRRKLMGLSQKALGDALDLSFQQVQKYECGSNRITAGRLYHISKILEVPIDYFFEALYEPTENRGKVAFKPREALVGGDKTPKETDHTQELFVSYNRIKDLDVRNTVFALTEQLGNYFSRK